MYKGDLMDEPEIFEEPHGDWIHGGG